ncbi:MAG: hypothetical protein ACFE9L_15335 [Candidatus Hodarchaeota archaeon]
MMEKNTIIALVSLFCFLLLLLIRMILVQPKIDLAEMEGLGEAAIFLVMVFQVINIALIQKKPSIRKFDEINDTNAKR